MKKISSLVNLLLITQIIYAQIPNDSLVAYYPLNGDARDYSGKNNNATIINASPSANRFGELNKCYAFNGLNQYIEIPDNDLLSITTTGKLSISVWMRPDTLNFEKYEGDGYLHWMGKGVATQHEWAFRIYNANHNKRPNRISAYAFNLSGDWGSGSYVQEPVTPRQWIHLVAVFNFPKNEIKIYKNGVLKDTDSFTSFGVTPANGTAPLRLGTRDFKSYFKGAIDDIRIYNKVLSLSEITALYNEPRQTTISQISALKTESEKSEINFYPNPAKEVLFFDAGDQKSYHYLIEIFNNEGQFIKKVEATSRNYTLSLKEMKKGTYWVRITDKGKGNITNSRVVVD